MLNPSHPGELIRDEILPSYGLTVAAAARVLRIGRPNLHRALEGKAAVSEELALKVEAAFGVSANILVNMQAAYDLAQARKRAAEITAGVERQPLAAG